MKTLSLHHDKRGSVDIISLEGILNADTNVQLDDLLQPLSDSDRPFILFDVANLTYISSAGIGCFIGIIKKIRMKGGDIRFYKMNSKVKRIFKLLDMDDFFEFFSDFDEAFSSFETL